VSSQFSIPNPCPRKWTDLHGDGRRRRCDVCRTSVHAIDQYSPDEWNQIWRELDGHVCGVLCEESLSGPRSRRAVLVGALLTAISPLMAQAGRVRIRVTDPTGAVIPKAEVSLVGPDDKPTQTAVANDAGEIVFVGLPFGDCRFAVVAQGFNKRPLTVTLRNGDEVKIETFLEASIVGEFVVVKTHKRWWRRLFSYRKSK